MNVKKAIVNAGILFFLLSIWLQGMTQLPRHRVCGFELNDTTAGDSKIFSPIHQELADNIRTNRSSVTIPVVFHLVYKNVNENIPDQVLVRQLEYLNRDFNGLNSDLANVPDHFKNLVGRANIRFCLASRDPSGFPTSGVVRIRTSMERIGVKEELHYTSRGGSDAWDTERYLNVWIADTGENIVGFGTAPGQRTEKEDGVVIHRDYLDVKGPSRTLTHEVGHYLGLFHMWNDECKDVDFVKDTPAQEYPYYGCPKKERGTCGNKDMFMNFMDYTDHDCMYFFTKGQVHRMEKILAMYRPGLMRVETNCQTDKRDAEFILFPNPWLSGSDLTIRFSNPVLMDLQLFNAAGVLVFKEKKLVARDYDCRFQLGASGVYFLAINGKWQRLVAL